MRADICRLLADDQVIAVVPRTLSEADTPTRLVSEQRQSDAICAEGLCRDCIGSTSLRHQR